MSDSRALTVGGVSRRDKLTQALDRDGAAGLSNWAKTWLYWNSGQGRRILQERGWRPKKFGIYNPVVVYQMGKVGSNTIYHSFKKLELDVPIFHVHYLNDLEDIEARTRRTMRNVERALENVVRAREVLGEMEQRKYSRWNFISLVRAPIPRLISMFFQNLDTFFPDALARYQAHTLTLDELTDFVVNRFQDQFMLEWFDKQIKEPFGIDVFAVPFNRVQGYQIYREREIRLLLLRAEDLNRVAARAIGEFLHIPNFQLVHRNVGQEKPTGALYSEFMQKLRLSPAMIERWHSSALARHFYTRQELSASIARWV